MKTVIQLFLLALLLSSPAKAADEHAPKMPPGPHGGKVLKSEPLHAEFWVQADKKVRVTFYDASMKPVTPQSQEVKVIVEAKSGKVTLEFEKNGDAYLSKTTLPGGDGYRVVIQIKKDGASKPQNFRLDYHDEVCKECKWVEYACVCDHAEGGDHSGDKH